LLVSATDFTVAVDLINPACRSKHDIILRAGGSHTRGRN